MSIQEHLNKIRNAIYGREVRESIAKGIETAYDDASKNGNANMEVRIARGTNPNLNTRLNKMEGTDRQNTAQLAHNTETLAGIDRTFGDLTFSTVAELQDAFPTGDTKRYVVASDGKWYWWNGTRWTAGQVAQAVGIAEKSIPPSKTTFFAESNWFNPETANVGFVAAGNVYTNATYYYSDYIPVKPGETILISGNIPSAGETYDADRNFVSNIGREVDADPNYTKFTIPDGVSYVRVNGFLGEFEDFIATPVENFMVVKGTVFPSEYAEYNNGVPYIKDKFLKLDIPDVTDVTPPVSPLAGKILVNDGDSITEGSNPNGGFFKNYGELVADRYDMTFHNLGMGGSTLSNVAGNNPFTERWENIPEILDYLTIWFGWNDQAYSTLGSIDDTVDTTFYGAWNTVLPKLIRKYPQAKIGLIVPYLPSGKEAWQQAVRDVGAKWGIPVLDLTDKDTPLIWLREGVDPVIGQVRRSIFTYDGTHLNQDGYEYMSTFYEHFLLSL